MEGTVTHVVISRPAQAAVVVCRVRDTRDRVYFPLRQVHTLVLADRVPYQTYYRALHGVSHGSIQAVSPALRAQLASQKALGPRARTASVVSIATLLKALTKLGVSPVVIDSFKAAQHGHLNHVAPEAGTGTTGKQPCVFDTVFATSCCTELSTSTQDSQARPGRGKGQQTMPHAPSDS